MVTLFGSRAGSLARLERVTDNHEVGSSNLPRPTCCFSNFNTISCIFSSEIERFIIFNSVQMMILWELILIKKKNQIEMNSKE
jgi:hypothetical protein